ncbi:MAG: flagellar basal body rod protein FlgC [Deltaproteobacteria bacterium]|nr:flagellar basal body rod protein FlgC [Deltaproteobacteria bacterium]
MDFFTALRISGSGLSVERARVNLASSNLANAEVTRTAQGGPYKRLDPVVESVPFDAYLNGDGPSAVRVSQVVQDQTQGRRVYSPGHPDADPEGFVTFPNVNPIHEVVNLMSASRGYEANATAVETVKGMAMRALDIAR